MVYNPLKNTIELVLLFCWGCLIFIEGLEVWVSDRVSSLHAKGPGFNPHTYIHTYLDIYMCMLIRDNPDNALSIE